MVWGLQLQRSQKAVLGGIFSLSLVDAIFDILRTIESLKGGTFSGVTFRSSLEVTIAVIVASSPLYRFFLTRKGRQYLISRSSTDHYKDIGGGQTGGKRKGSDDRSSRPAKQSIRAFRDDLETPDLGSLSHQPGKGYFSPAHLKY